MKQKQSKFPGKHLENLKKVSGMDKYFYCSGSERSEHAQTTSENLINSHTNMLRNQIQHNKSSKRNKTHTRVSRGQKKSDALVTFAHAQRVFADYVSVFVGVF